MYPQKSRKRVIGVVMILLIVAAGIYLYLSRSESANDPSATALKKVLNIPTPTPIPFVEMTIPHLRARSYKSALGPLQEVSQHAQYTAYLASYDSDGYKVNGILTKPAGQMPAGGWPAIVFIHGYIPPTQYQTLTQYSAYVDYLAREGFVVFKIDLRGHGDSEGEAGGGYYSPDYIIDALNASAALQSSDFVNDNKIGLWGHSMSGNVVLRATAAKPDIPATVIWAGAVYTYTDQQKYGINDNSYRPPTTASFNLKRRQLLRQTYGEFDPDHFFWKQVAATNYLKDLKGAIQLNHAIDDPVVDIGYSRDLSKLLAAAGVPHELKEYPSGGHNISGAAFNQAMQNTAEFFRKHL